MNKMGLQGGQPVPGSYLVYEMNRGEKVRFLLLCGLGLMAAGFLFYHSILLSLLVSLLAYPGLGLYRSWLAEKRIREMKEQFRDVLYSISASVSTGRQMPEALQEAGQNMRLICGEDSLMVKELDYMVKLMKEYRESEEEILKDFALRTGIEDITDFVDIYLTCRVTGGDLIRVLGKASEIIMDKIAIEKEIRAITVQKQFEAKILTAIPFIIILFLQIVSPDYLSAMYEGIMGRILMTAALGGIGFSYLWSMKLTKIEV
ncbi:MAG TPA: type II secretion system F family protein [Anaerovoracaceae bacterium]|nr:type II secretion system F family protein [Anaerovoracaceae bacterium]